MELYHALNRAVDGRSIFMEDRDYLRFVHDLYVFNDDAPADTNAGYHFQSRDIVCPYIERKRNRLVDIHAWCLMKNHYHLLLSERIENGLSLFLRKLNVGYARGFNEKYRRTGTLFQGRTKKIRISNDAHSNYILHYIHLNPLDYLLGAENWRVRSKTGIASARSALAYLSEYRWSSYLDYIGKKNFPSLLASAALSRARGRYADTLREYLADAEGDYAMLQLE